VLFANFGRPLQQLGDVTIFNDFSYNIEVSLVGQVSKLARLHGQLKEFVLMPLVESVGTSGETRAEQSWIVRKLLSKQLVLSGLGHLF